MLPDRNNLTTEGDTDDTGEDQREFGGIGRGDQTYCSWGGLGPGVGEPTTAPDINQTRRGHPVHVPYALIHFITCRGGKKSDTNF